MQEELTPNEQQILQAMEELEEDLRENTYSESTEPLDLIDKSHTCTCPWFHWHKKTKCVVHPWKQ